MDHLQERFDWWIRIVLIVLVIALVFLCGLLLHEYQELRAADMVSAHAPWLHGRPPAQSHDAATIQSWMTYDYINHIYALPPEYLQSTLGIVDTRYPHVSIAESAEAQKVTASELIVEVKNAVTDYLLKDGS